MMTKATTGFLADSGGEAAEVQVEITPSDEHQFSLFSELQLWHAEFQRVGGKFLATIHLRKPPVIDNGVSESRDQ